MQASNRVFYLLLALMFLARINGSAQVDSIASKLSFTGDFRFRVEQDWNSRKPDGNYRDDRSRLRYRLRFGTHYRYNHWASMGIRIRTGYTNKQQDPQLTLGDKQQEFGTLPIGLEKAYFEAKDDGHRFWIGKNTFPFMKQNELFWSDNVYPDGIFISKAFYLASGKFQFNTGHFIVQANGTSFSNDTYFQGFQAFWISTNGKLNLFPSLYIFRNIPNIPDGGGTFQIDHNIFHVGGNLDLTSNRNLVIEIDYYHNLADIRENDSIPTTYVDQKTGITIATRLGKMEDKGDWLFKVAYTYLEKYAAVDFLSQNDWTRWDYSAYGSPDGRLTNFKGFELQVGYAVRPNFTINSRFFNVEELVAEGDFNERGSRVRLDLDIGF